MKAEIDWIELTGRRQRDLIIFAGPKSASGMMNDERGSENISSFIIPHSSFLLLAHGYYVYLPRGWIHVSALTGLGEN
jgi:hypothetical protein